MVRTFTLDGSFGARPGQFLMVWLPGIDEKPFSVAFDDGRQTNITFFAVGPMSEALARCAIGDLVGLRGPFGTHYQWNPGDHLILVAGGYGAAPMYFVATEALKSGCTLDVIIGARSVSHLLYTKEFTALPHCTLHVTTDDGSAGFKGFNVTVLEQLLSSPSRTSPPPCRVLACGPERMLKAVSDLTAKLTVSSQLSLERFMKCGYGLCGNCAVDPLGLRLCTDGPVIDNDTCRQIAEFGCYHRDHLGNKVAF